MRTAWKPSPVELSARRARAVEENRKNPRRCEAVGCTVAGGARLAADNRGRVCGPCAWAGRKPERRSAGPRRAREGFEYVPGLSALLERRCLSAAETARAVGENPERVSIWARCKQRCPKEAQERLAEFLGVPLVELLREG